VSGVDIEVRHERGEVTVSVSGELDVHTAGQVSATVDGELVAAPGCVRLDLDGLDFIDSSGVTAIVHAYRACGDATRFELVGVHGRTREVLEMTGVLQLIRARR
jgi:anti-sigma B factor antagonist